MSKIRLFGLLYVTVVAGMFLDVISIYAGGASLFNKFSLFIFLFILYKGVIVKEIGYFKFVFISFVFLLAVNVQRFGFDQKNIYDIAQIGLFSCFLALCAKKKISKFNIFGISPGVILFVVTCALFLPSFFNVNFAANYNSSESSGSDIESLRGYYSGLFSVPHIPAYFYYYFSLYCLYKLGCVGAASRRVKLLWLLLLLSSVALCLIIGSRTPFYTALIIYIIYCIKISRHSIFLKFFMKFLHIFL